MQSCNEAQLVLLNIGGTAAGCAFGLNRDNPAKVPTKRQQAKAFWKALGLYRQPKAFRQYQKRYEPSLY